MNYGKKADPFYKAAAWQRVRKMALMRDRGMCCQCMRDVRDGRGSVVHRATMVHHIQPVDLRPDLVLELENLESLCDACHAREHPEKGYRPSSEDRVTHGMRVIKV